VIAILAHTIRDTCDLVSGGLIWIVQGGIQVKILVCCDCDRQSPAERCFQNQSDRYAIHQESARIGNVRATDHQNGSVKSASSPSPAKVSQNIFFCMFPAYFESQPMPFRVRKCYLSLCKQKKRGDANRPAFSLYRSAVCLSAQPEEHRQALTSVPLSAPPAARWVLSRARSLTLRRAYERK